MTDKSDPSYITIKMSDRHLDTTIQEWIKADFAHERSGRWPSTEFCWAPQRAILVDLDGHVWIDPYVECRANSKVGTHPVRIHISPEDGDGFSLEVHIEHCQDRWTKRPLYGRGVIPIDVLVG